MVQEAQMLNQAVTEIPEVREEVRNREATRAIEVRLQTRIPATVQDLETANIQRILLRQSAVSQRSEKF